MTGHSMTSAIEDLLAKIKPATASVRVCLRGDLLGDLDLINDDLNQFDGWEPSGMEVDPRTDLRARKAELEAEMRAESATFRFENIGELAWSNLLAKHPAREGKEEEEAFNAATFPVPAIAASCVDPKMTVKQVEQLFVPFTLTQRRMLFNAAYAANVRSVDVPFLQPNFDAAQIAEKKSK
jgi:hypothetical protein